MRERLQKREEECKRFEQQLSERDEKHKRERAKLAGERDAALVEKVSTSQPSPVNP